MDNESFNHEPREESTMYECDEGFADNGQQDDEPLGANSPEPHQFSRVYQLYTELDDDRQHDEPLEADSSDPRQLFLIHQFHSTLYDATQPASEMEIFCPQPIRQYPTHKVILQPELFEDSDADMSEPIFDDEDFNSRLFEDWHLDMSEPIFVDEEFSPEHLSVSSKTPPNPPELRKSFSARHDTPFSEFRYDGKNYDESVEAVNNFPARHDTPYPKFNDDDKDGDDELIEIDSPEIGRFFPAPDHQFCLTSYDPKPVLKCDDEVFGVLEPRVLSLSPLLPAPILDHAESKLETRMRIFFLSLVLSNEVMRMT